jgi:hypothetical protein
MRLGCEDVMLAAFFVRRWNRFEFALDLGFARPALWSKTQDRGLALGD